MLLEHEVEDLAEAHPDRAHVLVEQLTRPLQLYQNAAQTAEQRTAFLGKVRSSGGSGGEHGASYYHSRCFSGV